MSRPFSSPKLEAVPHSANILVVDDEVTLQKLLKTSLERIGHRVHTVATGTEALAQIRKGSIDLVLLDIMLPDMSGFDVCQEVRTFTDVPLVMLTVLNRQEDIVFGFNLGADDYITKPFRMREVQVRIEAILRRIHWMDHRTGALQTVVSDITIDERTQTVHVRGEQVHLTPIEYRLLRFLMGRPDRPIAKEEIFRHVWGYDLTGGTNLVEVAVRRLRGKIEEIPSKPRLILTVHAVGYKFVSAPMLDNGISFDEE